VLHIPRLVARDLRRPVFGVGLRLPVSVNKDDENALRLITDTKDALVAVSDVRVNREPGTMQEVSMDTYAIDKYTGMLTITTAATAAKVSEIKGNCAR
jgi:hypothetical protein